MRTKKILLAFGLVSLCVCAQAQWNQVGNDIYNTNTGNVGIGTTTPTKKLDIQSTGTTILGIKNSQVRSLQTAGAEIENRLEFQPNDTSNHYLYLTYLNRFGDSDRDLMFGGQHGNGTGNVNAWTMVEDWRGAGLYLGSAGGSNRPVVFGINRTERMRLDANGNLGIGYSVPSVKLDVNGVVRASSYQTSSDERLKTNVQKIDNALIKIESINGYTYYYDQNKFPSRIFPDGRRFGFLAQQIRKVFPDLVSSDGEGYLSVDYSSMIPVMLEAIKELKSQVDQLKTKQLASLEGYDAEAMTYYRGAALSQNAPNPFKSRATIQYFIPDNATTASIIIHDLSGKQLQDIQIPSKGAGTMTVNTGELEPGLYLYSLMLDGKNLITKKMILSE